MEDLVLEPLDQDRPAVAVDGGARLPVDRVVAEVAVVDVLPVVDLVAGEDAQDEVRVGIRAPAPDVHVHVRVGGRGVGRVVELRVLLDELAVDVDAGLLEPSLQKLGRDLVLLVVVADEEPERPVGARARGVERLGLIGRRDVEDPVAVGVGEAELGHLRPEAADRLLAGGLAARRVGVGREVHRVVRRGLIVVEGVERADDRVGWGAEPVQGALDQLVLVDQASQGRAHLGLRQPGVAHRAGGGALGAVGTALLDEAVGIGIPAVEAELVEVGGGRPMYGDVRVVLDDAEERRRHVGHEVDLAALEGVDQRFVVLEVLVDQLVDLRRAAPVVLVRLEPDDGVGVELDDPEGAGADRALDVLVVGLLEGDLLPHVLGEDRQVDLLETDERLAGRDDNGGGVGRLDRLDPHLLEAGVEVEVVIEEGEGVVGRAVAVGVVAVRCLRAGVGGIVGVDVVLEGETDVLGGQRLAILPLHALPDVIGPLELVVAHLVALGDPRRRLEPGSELEKEVVDVGDQPVVGGRRGEERVEAGLRGRLGEADLEDDLLLRDDRAGRERGNQARDRQEGQPPRARVISPGHLRSSSSEAMRGPLRSPSASTALVPTHRPWRQSRTVTTAASTSGARSPRHRSVGTGSSRMGKPYRAG